MRNSFLKYLLYYIAILSSFIFGLKICGTGYRNRASYNLTWQEVLERSPKYIVFSLIILIIIIRLNKGNN